VAAVNPGGFLRFLAMALRELARTQAALGLHPEALAAVTEAIAIQRQLVETNRRGSLAELAESLHEIASIHAAAGRRDEARAAGTETVASYEELASQYPEAFGDKLAAARQKLVAL